VANRADAISVQGLGYLTAEALTARRKEFLIKITSELGELRDSVVNTPSHVTLQRAKIHCFDKAREGTKARPPLEAAEIPSDTCYFFLTAQGFLAAQGFFAAHGFFAAQGFLAAQGFAPAIFFSATNRFCSQAFIDLATSGVNDAT